MYGLGFRLALKGGREAFVRIAATAVAVAVGVTILLGVLAEFHAFHSTSSRPSWESTSGPPASGSAYTPGAALWNYSENIYKGRFIEQLDVAALGPDAPRIPGLTRLPGAGQFYASPALSSLLKTVPAGELGDRFAGRQVGTIGDAALSGPDELVVVVGYSPSALDALPGSMTVDHVATAPELEGTTNLYQLAFGIAAITVLFPLLILINTATRLAATRREERFAALRLIGATPGDVNVIASVDAVIGALAGALIGIVVFLGIQPALASISFSGVRFFSYLVTPTLWGYVGMVVVVSAGAAVSTLVSLRRLQMSPLGVSRKVTPPHPRWWRIIPLVVGIPIFIEPLVSNPKNPDGTPAFAGLFLIMAGLVLGGSWLTMEIARILARGARGASTLLAARRLADNPKGAFRTASGLVLAVFSGTLIACILPAFNAAQSQGAAAQLAHVLRVPFTNGPGTGLSPEVGSRLVATLRSYPDVSVIPVYSNPQAAGAPIVSPTTRSSPPDFDIVSCSAMAALPVLGSCLPGVSAVGTDLSDVISTDNPLFVNKDLPAVTRTSPAAAVDLSSLEVSSLLVKTDDADTLERVRTYLTAFEASSIAAPQGFGKGNPGLTAYQMGAVEPETFGEVALIRTNDDKNIERVVFALVALTLIVAGCSLAVSVAGSLLDRKRPFTLLRLSGTPLSTLTRVVLMESAVPLVAATVVSAGVAIGVAEPPLRAIFRNQGIGRFAASAHPDPTYYLTMVAGLAVSLLVILAAMPLLNRMTQPEKARFE